MSSYTPNNYDHGTSSSRYIPPGYNTSNDQPHTDGDRQSHLTPPPRHSESSSSRPYTPPNPEQYNANPSYRAPLEDRPANPDVQAVQAAAGYSGGGRPRSGSSRSRAMSHASHGSRPSHDGRRPSHQSHHSHRSHHSSAAKSHHSSRHEEEPYRTESEREEYIKGLKRINSKRPT